MLIRIGNFDCTEVWDGVFYKKLSNYPKVTEWEIRTLIEFIEYEAKYGRDCVIECEDTKLLDEIQYKIAEREKYIHTQRPHLLTECTACPYRKGCLTEYVCHTTSVENAVKIFESGKLLSALKARNTSVDELMNEKRNAANDPADYFEYIMLAWGNCQAGDRLVMERKLERFPTDEDLSIHFTPGIRFYFKYDELAKHPNAVFEGVLPMKVKDEIMLSDWVYAIIIPTYLQDAVKNSIPNELKDRVIYVENDCKDIWDWSEKVYKMVESTEYKNK